MADAYKGLTIELNGDTTKLSTALRSVNGDIKSTQTQLKDVEKSLKLEPGNVTLVGQKFELCKKQVAETETKLKDLKQVEQAYASKAGTLTEEETQGYQKVQREIVNTESKLKGYNEQLKNSKTAYETAQTSAGKLGTSMENFSSKYQGTADKVSQVGATTAGVIGAIGTTAFTAAQSVEDGENIAIKTTGATSDAADALRESVDKVAENAPGDFETVGTAVGDVQQRFKLTGDDLDNLSTQFLKFSSNTGVDVSTAIQNCGQSMAAFNVDTDQAQNVLGMFQSVSQNTGIDVNTLMTDVNNNGATFREMGLNIQDSTALLGNFEQAGIPADTMLTGLKKAATNCAKSGKDMGGEMQDLAKKLQDPATQAEGTQEAIDLFGSKSALAFIDAAKTGRINLSDLGGSLENYSGKVDSTKDSTTTATDKIKNAWKNVQVALSKIGDAIAPYVEKVADKIKQLANWFEKLPQSTKDSIVKFGAFVGVLALVATTVGPIISLIGSLGFTIMFLVANPIVAIIAAIALVVAALVGLYNSNKDFHDFIDGCWQGICGFFQAAGKAIGDVCVDIIKWFANLFKSIGDWAQGVKDYWTGVGQWWSDRGNDIKNGCDDIGQKFGDLGNTIGQWASDRGNDFQNFADSAADKFGQAASSISDAMGNAAGWVGDRIHDIENAFSNAVLQLPSPKLPHINWHWNQTSFLGADIAVPAFDGIDWYAKGGIIDGASIIGVGEAGPEAVTPIDKLSGIVADAMREVGGNAAGGIVVNIDGAQINAHDAIRSDVYSLLYDLKRYNPQMA